MRIAGRSALAVWLIIAAASLAWPESPEKLTLTLEDCIQIALSQNPSYLAVREREAGAKAMVREAASRFFPSLDLQGSDVLDKKVFVIEFPSFIPGEPPQRVSVDFTKNYQFSFNFSLPLFTGGRLISGYKQAGYNLQSTRETIRQSKQETVFNIKRAFYSCLLCREMLETAEEAVVLAEKHYANVKNLYDVGMASKFDLLRSEVAVANLKPQFIRAKNDLSVADLSIKTLLGIDLDRPVELKGEMVYKAFEGDIDEAVGRALQMRPEIGRLKFQKQMAAEMVKIARAEHLPTLALVAGYNYWSNDFRFTQNNWESYYSVNLVMTMPLFKGFAVPARVAQSKAALREIEFGEKALLDAVRFEVNQAVINLEQARETLLSTGKNVEQALEAVRIAELNYAEGLATNLDVSTAQVALSQARTNYSQALYSCVISLAQLEKATGTNWGGGESK